MHLADDRRDVMLAVALEADVLEHDDLIVAVGLFEGAAELVGRIGGVAREIFVVGADDATGRAFEALTIRIVARPADEDAHGLLGLFARGASAPAAVTGRLAGMILGHDEKPQLSRTGWCGLSSEKAGMSTSKCSPLPVSIW